VRIKILFCIFIFFNGVFHVLQNVRRKINIRKIFAEIYTPKSTISKRLIFSFLIISILPICLIGSYSFISTYNDMEMKSKDFSAKISTQISNNIAYVFDSFVDKINRISSNNVILHELYNLQSYDKDAYSPIEIKQTLASIIGAGIGIDSVEICSQSGARIYYSLPISKGSARDSKLLYDTSRTNDVVWKIANKEMLGDNNRYIIISKNMRLDPNSDEIAGYCLMSIKREYVDELCKYNTLENKHYIIITTKEGLIISHPDKNMVLTQIDPNILNKIDSMELQNTGKEKTEKIFSFNMQEGNSLVSYSILDLNGWRIISVIPYAYLMNSTVQNGILTLSIVFILIILSILFALVITSSISSPIKKLASAMQRVGQGDLSVKLDFDNSQGNTKDELVILGIGFTEMLSRLVNLINDVFQSKIKEKELEFLKTEAELNALQQQINPHFLYNILESIFWISYEKGEIEISKMITALGNFFRTSINKGLEYITVENEVMNVKNYVYLQRIRFNERFSVKWLIDDKVLNYKIIKFILQPIIENAIIHGLENIQSGGMIIIKGFNKKDNLIFEIIDNGVGMSEEEVENLYKYINSTVKDITQSIGVKNVNQRIKLYYGNEYGVEIYSRINKGTRVILKLPATMSYSPAENPGIEKLEAVNESLKVYP